MRLFNPVCYETALPYLGQPTRLLLRNGQWLEGQVIAVRPDGILFNSSNPGLFFYPFAAIALLALSFGVGYGIGRSSGYYPYRPHPYYF
ncbi:MAG: hypothetical protein GX351_00815 [Peptococcaceae bacterium]|nr:hypothetical protein [Peptococcaceae bacterium]